MKTILTCILVFDFVLSATCAESAFRFAGKVVDAAGNPVDQAVVARYEYDESAFRPYLDWEMKEQTTTSKDGSFELSMPRRQGFFLVTKTGFAPVWRQFWNLRQDLTNQQIILASPMALSGVVLDESDKPVADAQVYVNLAITESTLPWGGRTYNYLRGKIARSLFNVRTRADGQFRIEGLPEAGLDLGVQASGKALPNPVRENMGPESTPWHSGDAEIKLVVEPAGSIEGKVVEQEGGRPLSDVQLILQAQPGGAFGQGLAEPVRSKSDGTFKIPDIAAGSYRVRAFFGPEGAPDWVAEPVNVSVEKGRATADVRLSAVRGGLLQVRTISRPDRQPLTNIVVSAYREDFQASARSSTNGVALLRLLPGDYQINAYRDSYRAEPQSAAVRLGETNQLEVELAPPRKIRGIVRRPDGRPAVGAEIRLVSPGAAGGLEKSTDGSGHFEIELDSQNYGGMSFTPCLLIRLPENGWAVAQEIDEETGLLDLRLAPGITIVGMAKTADGQPITNVTAALVFWSGNSGMHLQGLTTKTNSPGHFEIPAMPPERRYGVIVSAPGFGQRSIHQVPTETGDSRVQLDPVELNVANLRMAGQVLDQDDKPAPGANVTLQGEGQPMDQTRTDRDGRFEFTRVCEGPAQIFTNFRNTFGNASAQGGDTNVTIRLQPQRMPMATANSRQQIKGVVTAPDGKPVAGARVRLFTSMNFNSQWNRTDSNGVYRLFSNPMPGGMGSPWLVAQHPTTQTGAALEVEEGATEINIQLTKGGTIVGRVQDAEGRPLTNASIELMLYGSRMENRWDDKPIRSDGQGEFQIAALPPEPVYRIYASAPGYGRSRQEVIFEDSLNPKIDLQPFLLRPANLQIAGQVVNEEEKPMPNAQVQVSGTDQPQTMTTTDRQGRFKLKVCEGPVRLFVHSGDYFSSSTIEGGETNALITLTRRSLSGREPSRRPSLLGKLLPDLASVGLPADALPGERPALLCLLDWEQRLSRRALRVLEDQADLLKERELTVVLVQAAPATDETWEDLKASSKAESFLIGRVAVKEPQTRWATEAKPLPWLILVNRDGRVTAEGFSPDELEEKIDELK